MYYIYLITNRTNRVLYTGVTNNLVRRLYEHRNRLIPGFTSHYCADKLVYFEQTPDVRAAIAREKQIKGWTRVKKNALVEAQNPHWKDISTEWEKGPQKRKAMQ